MLIFFNRLIKLNIFLNCFTAAELLVTNIANKLRVRLYGDLIL